MKKLCTALMLASTLAALPMAEAQIFSKKPKTPPAQRIGELIGQVKTDASDSKRAAAAVELGSFDAKSFPELVPLLADVARTDKSANVRNEAIDSLARIRPVSQLAGQTIEWAAANDDSWKVRWQAKTALTRYQWAGYRAGKGDAKGAVPPSTQEPPLIDAPAPPASSSKNSRPAPGKVGAPATVAGPKTPQAPKGATPSAPKTVVVTQPPNGRKTAPVTPTPPPIIIEAPATVAAPPVKAPTPAIPVANPGQKAVLPPIPEMVISPSAAEPNFRPAGQSPPRLPPTPKNDDRGPPLTPPPME